MNERLNTLSVWEDLEIGQNKTLSLWSWDALDQHNKHTKRQISHATWTNPYMVRIYHCVGINNQWNCYMIFWMLPLYNNSWLTLSVGIDRLHILLSTKIRCYIKIYGWDRNISGVCLYEIVRNVSNFVIAWKHWMHTTAWYDCRIPLHSTPWSGLKDICFIYDSPRVMYK